MERRSALKMQVWERERETSTTPKERARGVPPNCLSVVKERAFCFQSCVDFGELMMMMMMTTNLSFPTTEVSDATGMARARALSSTTTFSARGSPGVPRRPGTPTKTTPTPPTREGNPRRRRRRRRLFHHRRCETRCVFRRRRSGSDTGTVL